MKDHWPPTSQIDEQARVYLVARVAVIYLLTTVAIALATDFLKVDLAITAQGASPFLPSNLWLAGIWFWYYIVPFALAVLYGFLFRPFWQSFRNLGVTILVLQFIFSFGVALVRWEYLGRFEASKRWSKHDQVLISDLQFWYFDHDQDGYKDELQVGAALDMRAMRPGQYVFDALVVPGGGLSPVVVDGGGTITVLRRGEENVFRRLFKITPRARSLQSTAFEFQLKFVLSRIIEVDERGRKILEWSRWSPFLRATHWQGDDPQIAGDWIVVGSVTRPEIFTLVVDQGGTP